MLRVRKLLILVFVASLLVPQLIASFEGFHKARYWPFLAYDMYSRARQKGDDTGIYELWIHEAEAPAPDREQPGSPREGGFLRERLGTSLLWQRESFVRLLARAIEPPESAGAEARAEVARARETIEARIRLTRSAQPERLEVRRFSVENGTPLEADPDSPEAWELLASWRPAP